jgi:uncharacterized protein YjeT (DUF2065 family)
LDWTDLTTGIALLLIFEGIMPFIFPGAWRKFISQVNGMSDRQIRIIAIVCLFMGLILLRIARS